jgi:hypothetical protein
MLRALCLQAYIHALTVRLRGANNYSLMRAKLLSGARKIRLRFTLIGAKTEMNSEFVYLYVYC